MTKAIPNDLARHREAGTRFPVLLREVRDLPGTSKNGESMIPVLLDAGDGVDASDMLRGKPPKLPQKTYIGPDHERITIPDFMAILNEVFPDQMEKFWEAKVKLAADLAGAGVTDEERMKRTLAIKQEQLAHEFEEEKLILDLRAQGTEVDRRAEADVRAVLNLPNAETMPEPKERWRYG